MTTKGTFEVACVEGARYELKYEATHVHDDNELKGSEASGDYCFIPTARRITALMPRHVLQLPSYRSALCVRCCSMALRRKPRDSARKAAVAKVVIPFPIQ